MQLRGSNCRYLNLAGTRLPVKAKGAHEALTLQVLSRRRKDFSETHQLAFVILVTRGGEVNHGGSRASLQIW
jgi:hypothetical protein